MDASRDQAVVPMNRESLANLLMSLTPLPWRRSRFREGPKREARWVPVFDLHGHGLPVGLTDGGAWVIESVEGLVPLDSKPGLDSLLECLYSPLQQIRERLRRGIQALGLPVESLASFPFVELVAYALDFSPFYAELAIEWLEEGSVHEELLPLLQSVLDAGGSRFPEQLLDRVNRLCSRIRSQSRREMSHRTRHAPPNPA